MSEEEKRLAQVKMAEAMIGLALSLWMVWTLIPEHRRKLWRMGVLMRLQRLTGSAARRAGAASMRAELATGTENYHLAYGLALVREGLAAAYDRTRGVTP